MSAKMSERRRAAFLKALEETGNIGLSAERAKVSRSWVRLHRTEHPEFDAGCRAAVAAAKACFDALRAEGSGKPPRGWGSLDGVSLVVRGSGGSGRGRRVQIARARVRQWCPRTEARFLTTLAATCNVKAACAEVGMWPPSAYNHRNQWPAFARRWDAAIETGYVRIEAALVAHAGNIFSDDEIACDAPMPPMTVDQALHLLHMHKHAVKGIGWRPGRRGRDPTMEEVHKSVMRKIEAIERGEGVSAADKARDAREWAARRGSG